MIFQAAATIFREEMKKAISVIVVVYRTMSEMDARALEILGVFFRNR